MIKCIELKDGNDVLLPCKVKEVSVTLSPNQWVSPFNTYAQVATGLLVGQKIIGVTALNGGSGASTNAILCKVSDDSLIYVYGMREAVVTVRIIYI